MSKNKKGGFTLIELIVVIGILAVLALVLIPNFLSYINEANVSVDKANLRVLNTATALYKAEYSHQGDLFEGLTTDLTRQFKLLEESYLQQVILPQKSDSIFYWDIEEQLWKYSESLLAIEESPKLVFKDLLLADYRKTGTWRQNEEGFLSSSGILFIPNPSEEYSVSSVARLPAGTSGGYGLLVETSLTESNRDSGYSIQLDRGLGGIVIRKRTDTRESNVIAEVYNRNNSIIPASKSDAWWTQEHTMKVDIKNSAKDGKKIINVYINDVKVIADFEIDANRNADANFTGLRSWSGEVTYKDVEINK